MQPGSDSTYEILMRDFREGSEAAFDTLFREIYPSVCFYGYKITGQQALAEELAGEAFLKVWNRRSEFFHFHSLKSYLYTITRNACIDWLRKQRGMQKAGEEVLPLLEETAPTAMQALIMAETYRQLHIAINELPPQCRKVITLSFMEGMNGRQVAGALGMETGTVKSQKARGLQLLKKKLKLLFPLS